MKQTVSFSDIRKRINSTSSIKQDKSSASIIENALKMASNKNARPVDIQRTLESTVKSNTDIPFYVYMELYDALCNSSAPVSMISKMGNFIADEAVSKVRSAKETQTLIKRRMANMKNKVSKKLNHSLDDFEMETKAPAMKVKKSMQPNQVHPKKESAILEAYTKILDNATLMVNCDRIIENYNSISKRFNLEILFTENGSSNGIYDTVVELCKLVDTYSMPDGVKFNSVIETAFYGFETNHIEYEKSEILEAAIDYFAFKQNGLQTCKSILEATILYDKDDYDKSIDVITEEEPEEDEPSSIQNQMIDYCSSKSTVQEFDLFHKKKDKDKKKDDKKEDDYDNSQFNNLFKEFKEKELEKNPESKLRTLISKLYSRSVDGVIEGTPKLLTWIRTFFILGTASFPVVGPIIMIIGLIADRFISLHYERKQVEQMLKCFDEEIKKSKEKLNSITNSEDKARMEKYIKALKDAKEKIEEYQMSLLSDDEMSAKYDNMDLDSIDFDDDSFKSSDGKDDDFDFDLDDDFDFDDDDLFDESTLLESMNDRMEGFSSIMNYMPSVDEKSMYNLVYEIDNDDDLTNIAIIAASYPEEFYAESVKAGIEDNLNNIKKNKVTFESAVTRALRITALTNSLNILAKTNPQSKPRNIREASTYLEVVTEAYIAIGYIISAENEKSNTVLEASIVNSLKMASMKLKKAIQTMKDKDKQISQSIDLSVNNVKKGVEKALTTDNREAVIKGSILPSASKAIKLGIVNAGLIALGQPLVALITTLGYIGTNAAFKGRERQMVVDEIEIELKMCEKYIEIAESKNDMKALKQLLSTQRDLERQLQRIKYRMKVELGQKVYDTKNVKPN